MFLTGSNPGITSFYKLLGFQSLILKRIGLKELKKSKKKQWQLKKKAEEANQVQFVRGLARSESVSFIHSIFRTGINTGGQYMLLHFPPRRKVQERRKHHLN